MKGLAVSNIAWPTDQNDAVAKLLLDLGVSAIEVAPSKLFSDPSNATDDEIDRCRKSWADRGFKIVAAQALLFGKPELTIFESKAIRTRTEEYLRKVIHTCARLGAEALVFGSPKNRWVGGRDRGEVFAEAVEFFRTIGRFAAGEGTAVVMEAIPPQNGADYVTRAMEAIELVRAVDHPGFRLHLDTACMTLASDPITEVFEAGFPLLRHFHISEAKLAPVGTGDVDHAAFARELHKRNYTHWISIEMRDTEPFDLSAMEQAVQLVNRVYLG